MGTEPSTHLDHVDVTTAAPSLPRQRVVRHEPQATRKRKALPVQRIVVGMAGVAVIGLVAASLTTGTADPKTPAVTASDASATFPMQAGNWRLESLDVRPEAATGDLEATARITYDGLNWVVEHQPFTVSVFRDGQFLGTLIGAVAAAEPGKTQEITLGSSQPYVAGARTYTFRMGR